MGGGAVARAHGSADRLVEQAEQALADSMRLDFRRPFLTTPYNREPVRAAFFAACQAGDARSCWMVREVQNHDFSRKPAAYEADATARVIQHCRAGDLQSCSALSAEDLPGFDDLPGHVGRSSPCSRGSEGCDLGALGRECQAGYADSCATLRQRQSADADHTAVTAATRRLVRDGCHAGLTRDCGTLVELVAADESATGRADRIFAREQLCTIALSGCDKLGLLYLPAEREKAQLALERACQLVDFNGDPVAECEDLWKSYTARPPAFPEPVPGRAARLHAWACKKYHLCW